MKLKLLLTLWYLLLISVFPDTISRIFAQSGPTPAVVVINYADMLPWVFNFPSSLNETSGIIHYDDALWTFNDSGGKAELYKIDAVEGEIIQTLVLNNAENNDWESLCQDEDFIYIGDFGNNLGNRKNLCIYKIAKDDIAESKKVKVNTEKIVFSYTDQHTFEIKNRNNNFDCEAMISFEDRLILFSKNWVNGKTRMYTLSKAQGIYALDPTAEFEANGLITGADFNEKSKNLVLIGYTNKIPFIYLFYTFNGDDFKASYTYQINFPRMAEVQTEGICFLKEDRIAISAEKTKSFNQALYMTYIHDMLGKGEGEINHDRH